MGSSGLEPPTSRLSGARSNLLSYEPVRENGSRKPFYKKPFSSSFQKPSFLVLDQVLLLFFLSAAPVASSMCSLRLPLSPLVSACPGIRTGDDGIRTHDPLLAGQVLSQLSYTPIFSLLSLSCTLIRFSMSIQASLKLLTKFVVRLYSYLNLFKSL